MLSCCCRNIRKNLCSLAAFPRASYPDNAYPDNALARSPAGPGTVCGAEPGLLQSFSQL